MQRRCLSLRGPALLCPPLFFSPTLLLLCSDLSLFFSALVILLNVPVIAAAVLSCHQGRNLSSASLALCLIPCSGNYLFPCHHCPLLPSSPFPLPLTLSINAQTLASLSLPQSLPFTRPGYLCSLNSWLEHSFHLQPPRHGGTNWLWSSWGL